MANISIKELLAADTVSDLVDKINFNFDQLLLNGGGPPGGPGKKGDEGAIGPRGTLWFTAVDLYTTTTSPSWSGTPERINDILLTSYPQFGGDPNRYLPVGNGPNPQNTFVFGNVNKMLRDGDLYLQEGDDTFESYESRDGDIWEYDGFTFTWVFTGVNIKGDQGTVGADGFQQWLRTSNLTDDVLYPKDITGQDNPRILVGIANDIFNRAHPTSKSTFMSNGTPQVAIGHETLHGGGGGDNLLMPTFTAASDGSFIIQGSQNGTSPQIVVQSSNAEIILTSGGSTFMTYSQEPDTVGTPTHSFSGGRLFLTAPNANSVHTLQNTSGRKIDIGIATSNYHTINSDTIDIVLQQGNNRNVGIGTFNLNSVLSKLSVVGNTSIGSAYITTAAPTNGIIVEGQAGFGYDTLKGNTQIQSAGPISYGTNGGYFHNTYWDGSYKRLNVGRSAIHALDDANDGLGLWVGPNGAVDSVITQLQVYHIDVNTAFMGLGTILPQEGLHINDRNIMHSTSATISNSNSWKQQYVGNVLWSHRENTQSGNLSWLQFLGNAPGALPHLNLYYDDSRSKNMVGIKSPVPLSDFEVKGESNRDTINMGDFDTNTINDIVGGDGANGTGNTHAGAYVGFNAYVDDQNNNVVFKSQQGVSGTNDGSGFIIFMDRFGNMHIAFSRSQILDSAPSGGVGLATI